MSSKSVDMTEVSRGGWEGTVRRAVAGIRYGSVEVLVHDGRVVQVETREKVRFPYDRQPDDRRRNAGDHAGPDRKTGGTPPAENEETNE